MNTGGSTYLRRFLQNPLDRAARGRGAWNFSSLEGGGFSPSDVSATGIILPAVIGDAESIHLPDGRTACFEWNTRRANCPSGNIIFIHVSCRSRSLKLYSKHAFLCTPVLSFFPDLLRTESAVNFSEHLDKPLPPLGIRTFQQHILPGFPI